MNREADMNTRRDFLKRGTAAGIVFCGCGMMDAARAQQPGAQRLPVTLNGKRVKTIDVHAHCHFREAVALTGEDESRILPRTKGSLEHYIVIEQRLKGMDAQAIDMEVLSINPFWYRRERDLAAKIVEVQNEKLAELCASRPDRFAAFASLALQFPDLAVLQRERCEGGEAVRPRRAQLGELLVLHLDDLGREVALPAVPERIDREHLHVDRLRVHALEALLDDDVVLQRPLGPRQDARLLLAGEGDGLAEVAMGVHVDGLHPLAVERDRHALRAGLLGARRVHHAAAAEDDAGRGPALEKVPPRVHVRLPFYVYPKGTGAKRVAPARTIAPIHRAGRGVSRTRPAPLG